MNHTKQKDDEEAILEEDLTEKDKSEKGESLHVMPDMPDGVLTPEETARFMSNLLTAIKSDCTNHYPHRVLDDIATIAYPWLETLGRVLGVNVTLFLMEPHPSLGRQVDGIS